MLFSGFKLWQGYSELCDNLTVVRAMCVLLKNNEKLIIFKYIDHWPPDF
jgi:hypothetical protein